MDFARSEFTLAQPGEDGVSLRAKAEHIFQTTGHLPEILRDAKTCPLELLHVWSWFVELDEARTGNGFGANPIPFQEILAWKTLTGNEPSPWEVSLMRQLDRISMEVSNARDRGTRHQGEYAVDHKG